MKNMNFAKVCCVGLVLASGMLMAAERVSLNRGWLFAQRRGRAENWVSTGGMPEKVV